MAAPNDLSILTNLTNLNTLMPVVQSASPTTGQTVQMTDDSNDGTLYITPATNLAALTIAFPSDANSRIGQIRRFATNKIITLVTLSGGTILNAVTAMVANDCFSYQKVAANTWVRIQ